MGLFSLKFISGFILLSCKAAERLMRSQDLLMHQLIFESLPAGFVKPALFPVIRDTNEPKHHERSGFIRLVPAICIPPCVPPDSKD